MLNIKSWPVGKLTPYPGNPRTITDKAVAKVAESLEQFGFQQPIVVDQEGVIIVGHTRFLAAKRLGLKRVPVQVADLSETAAAAYRIADNRTGEEAQWNEELLRKELAALAELGDDEGFTGFDDEELAALLSADGSLTDDDITDADGEERGSLLNLIEVTIAPPQHTVTNGEVYQLRNHFLVCAGVMLGWPLWAPLLKGSAVFCPYPGPLTLYGRVPDERALVMVQPDTYTCGHILDRFAEIDGEDAIIKRME